MVNRDRDPDPIGMADVIATRMLGERPEGPLKLDGVLAAVAALADCLATDPERLAQRLVDTARDLTGAASAGLSLEETADGEEIFRWIATSGEFARYVNGTMPRHFSPCGTVVDADEAMLMRQPVRCYPAVASLHAPIQEALLVPFHVGGRPVGTVWVISHADDKCFNAQDLRVVQALSSLAAAGVQTMRAIDALNNARQQQEGRLVESLATASTLQQWFDHAPGFVALLRGSDHVFEMVNPAYYQLVGHRSIIGKPAFDALPDVRDQGFEELIDKVYRTGEPFTGYGLSVSLQRVPGAATVQAYLDLSYHPVRGADGAVAGVFAQGHDVTDQHLALRRLEDADRQKDEFVATLAHELRNPLAPIRQAVRIAQSSNAAESQKRWSLEVIERQVNTMALLLDDLLDVARVARGQLVLRKEVVTIASVLEAALETARPIIEAKHHSCDVDLPSQQVLLHADALRLSQVFNNLLTNAAKYTDPRGKIWVTVALQNGVAAVSVRDTGMGLPAEALKTVFKMFSQLSATSERAQGGLGIGLALTRGLVELHGGTIEARSAGLGFGSEFIVHLPVLANARLEEPAPVAKDAPTSSPRRVLLADDNVDAVDSLAVLLSLDGYDVKAAFDGEQARQMAESLRPDVCILDIGMPKLNGHEVARRIRLHPWGKHMVLVALTGWGKEEDAAAAKAAGFDHHCTKPVDPQELSRWISAETRADRSRG